ncbi:unnamed protein product [Clonostachys chloroleuca]|uniref:DUF7702 domain-containing protein n=1 Tax=Clonostachys chloroleuca TaxID=1926264 RepID=A0AA35LRT5_9HYPO|nr:unnamed protein product [Clonostachys chloroleuca]
MSGSYMPNPPSTSTINLTIADLTIYAVLLFPMLRITWKHGKSGMVCWPVFLSFLALRYVSDAYLIANRHKPQIPNPVIIMTNTGSIVCLSLIIVGIIYERNVILSLPPRRWTEKVMLAVTHLTLTTGITLATYGGSPKQGAPGGVISKHLNQIGTYLMLFVMLFGVGWWLWNTGKRAMSPMTHPNFKPARWLLLAGCAAFHSQLVRLGHTVTYSSTP